MSGNIPEEFVMLKGEILDGMVDAIETAGEDADYTVEAIDTCATILGDYLEDVFSPSLYGQSKKIMAAVKFTVNELNELNDDCNQNLIDTEQRDQLRELIVASAAYAGLETEQQDITEEWRAW
ncbi:hypothetical protein [Porticoccus sp.]